MYVIGRSCDNHVNCINFLIIITCNYNLCSCNFYRLKNILQYPQYYMRKFIVKLYINGLPHAPASPPVCGTACRITDIHEHLRCVCPNVPSGPLPRQTIHRKAYIDID